MRLFFPLSGDDIFISYSRRDGALYAAGLADKLTEKKLSCFIDKLGTEPNHDLPPSLKKKIKNCTVFVLVGTEKAAQSEFVKKEIAEFKQTGRTILPIDFDGSVGKAIWYKEIPGLAVETEKDAKALETGNPSQNVINFVEKSFNYTRRNQFMSRMFWGALSVFLVLVGLGVGASYYAFDRIKFANEKVEEAKTAELRANEENEKARKAEENAIKQEQIAKDAKTEATKQSEIAKEEKTKAEKAGKLADEKTRLALEKTNLANEKTKLADLETKRANEEKQKAEQAKIETEKAKQQEIAAKAEADKQQRIVRARQLLSRADAGIKQIDSSTEIRPWGFGNTVDQWSDLAESNMLLAIEGARRLGKEENLPSSEAVQALYDGFEFLPRSTKFSDENKPLERLNFSSDGKSIITVDDEGNARVKRTADGQITAETKIKGYSDDAVFSPNENYIVEVNADGINLTSVTGNRLWGVEGEWKILGFTADENLFITTNKNDVVIFETKTGREEKRIPHLGEIERAVLSADGTLIATDSYDNVPIGQERKLISRIWEVPAGDKLFQLELYRGAINIAKSPDERLLAVADGSKIEILDLKKRENVKTIKFEDYDGDKTEYAVFMNFSPDGKQLGVIGDYGTSELIDIETEDIIWDIPTAFGAKPLSARYVSIIDAPGIEIWDVATGKSVARVIYKGEIQNLSFDSQNKRLAVYDGQTIRIYYAAETGDKVRVDFKDKYFKPSVSDKYMVIAGNKTVPVWELESGREIAKLVNDADVNKIALSRDNRYLATTGDDETLRLWKISSGKQLARVDGIPSGITEEIDDEEVKLVYVHDFFFSNSGKYLVVEGGDDVTRVYEISAQDYSLREVKKVKHLWTADFSFSPDEKYFAAVEKGFSKIYESSSGREVSPPVFHKNGDKIIFSPDGKLFASSDSTDDTVNIWKLPTGNEIGFVKHEMSGLIKQYNPGGIYYVLFSPDGKHLITVNKDKTSKIFDIARNQFTAEIKHELSVENIFFSPTGRYSVTTLTGNQVVGNAEKFINRVYIWDLATMREIGKIEHNNEIRSITFSHNEKLLASLGSGGTVNIYDITKQSQISTLKQNEGINDLEFSRDDKYISTAGNDKTARIWEVTQAREAARFYHNGAVYLAKFSSDGKYLISAGSDKTLRMRLWNPADIIEEACSRLTRNLSKEEWQFNFGSEPYAATCSQIPLP